MAKNNVWKMTAKDKDGKPVESAPGMFSFTLRGPEDIKTIRTHATILLNSMRRRHWQNNGEDPGYVVDKIEPAGFSDVGNEPMGAWAPPGESAPVNLPLPPDDEGNPQATRRGRTTHE